MCEQYIRSLSKEDRIIFVLSGNVGRQTVPRIYQLQQISAIYVYCMNKKSNEQWAKQYSKIKDHVVVQLDDLINRIRGNQSQNYSSVGTLSLYTKDSFLYRLLDKVLRAQDIDLLFLLRFVIRDIEQGLERNKCSSTMYIYRGQQISNEEIEMLKNSFLSSSFDPEKAELFCSSPSESLENLTKVIFEIDANLRLHNIKSFSDISSQSDYSGEREVLFMLGSIFRLINIHQNNNGIWIIQMKLCTADDHQ